MLLEGQPAGWFTNNIELRLNGRVLGIGSNLSRVLPKLTMNRQPRYVS
jgi:hypothetical protein